jgi:hypothetical protein
MVMAREMTSGPIITPQKPKREIPPNIEKIIKIG